MQDIALHPGGRLARRLPDFSGATTTVPGLAPGALPPLTSLPGHFGRRLQQGRAPTPAPSSATAAVFVNSSVPPASQAASAAVPLPTVPVDANASVGADDLAADLLLAMLSQVDAWAGHPITHAPCQLLLAAASAAHAGAADQVMVSISAPLGPACAQHRHVVQVTETDQSAGTDAAPFPPAPPVILPPSPSLAATAPPAVNATGVSGPLASQLLSATLQQQQVAANLADSGDATFTPTLPQQCVSVRLCHLPSAHCQPLPSSAAARQWDQAGAAWQPCACLAAYLAAALPGEACSVPFWLTAPGLDLIACRYQNAAAAQAAQQLANYSSTSFLTVTSRLTVTGGLGRSIGMRTVCCQLMQRACVQACPSPEAMWRLSRSRASTTSAS